MWLNSIGSNGHLLWGLALVGAGCCTGCGQEPRENAGAGAATDEVAKAKTMYLVDAKPVVHGEDGPVTIRVTIPEQRVALNGQAKVEVSLDIAPSYHVYGELPEDSPFTALRVEGGTDGSGAQKFVKAHLPLPTELSEGLPVYRDSFAVSIPATVSSTQGDKFLFTIRVQYQACNDLACFPPEKVELNLPVNIRLTNEARRQ